MSSKDRQAAGKSAAKAVAQVGVDFSQCRPDRPACCLACGFRYASI